MIEPALDPRLSRLPRLQPAPAQREQADDLVKLPLTRQAFVYQRLSTHEQRKKTTMEIKDCRCAMAAGSRWRISRERSPPAL